MEPITIIFYIAVIFLLIIISNRLRKIFQHLDIIKDDVETIISDIEPQPIGPIDEE